MGFFNEINNSMIVNTFKGKKTKTLLLQHRKYTEYKYIKFNISQQNVDNS